MQTTGHDIETESEKILHRKLYSEEETDELFYQTIENASALRKEEDKALVKKAYQVARTIHKGQKRQTGDSFIFHLYSVMKIVLEDIGLGATGAATALLHEITFQTDLRIEDINYMFGPKISSSIDSLTRIKGTSEHFRDSQPEVYKKIILGLADDITIILIKLADRLDNMRTLAIRTPEKQYQVAYETMQIYAPLAHRLGISRIKTELEDLSFKYINPKAYNEIVQKLQSTEDERKAYINKFTLPIIDKLMRNGIKFDIKGRPKSIYSIYHKITKKKVSFEEVYDKFAIRIIFTPQDPEKQKEECLKIVKLLSDDYYIHPERTRDWINVPKENGYQAYHITVYDAKNKCWVEIQIRSVQMDEIAEYGFAAHWKYKGIKDKKNQFDDQIKLLKQKLEDPQNTNFDFLENFKVLISDEISVYSPDGDITTLPSGSTVLDYVYYHNEETAGNTLGAKVNQKMMPISTRLKNGDLVAPVTSSKISPKPEWLHIAITPKARKALQKELDEYIKTGIAEGQKILHALIKKYNIEKENEVTNSLIKAYDCISRPELLQRIYSQKISQSDLEQSVKKFSTNKIVKFWKLQFGNSEKKDDSQNSIAEYLNNVSDQANYGTAECCSPLPGDDAIGIIENDNTIYIHKKNCLYATLKIQDNPRCLLPVKWKMQRELSGIAKITISGVDQKGVLQKIITIITQELNLNLKTIHIESDDINFNGFLEVYVRQQTHLEKLQQKLLDIKEIQTVMAVGEEIYQTKDVI